MANYKTTTAKNFLIAFANGDTWKDLWMKESKTHIIRDTVWNKLERVWNDGRGRLVVAEKNDTTIFYNAMLLSKAEIKHIKDTVKDKEIKFVFLGYPHYYQHGLISLYKKEGEKCLVVS